MSNEYDGFKEYCRSASFRLELSNKMIRTLLLLKPYIKTERHCMEKFEALNQHNIDFITFNALKRRGLIEWRDTATGKSGPYLTQAGRIVTELLEHAEFHKELFVNIGEEVV